MPSTFGPQNMEELAYQLPTTYMNHIFFGTSWAEDADLLSMEFNTWNDFDDRAANVNEAPWIFNGVYQLSVEPSAFESSAFMIRVYTVQGGRLRGRRVVKFKNGETGRWKAFATLRRDGSLFVWSAFRGEEHRRMVVAANFGLINLAAQVRRILLERSDANTRNGFSTVPMRLIDHRSNGSEGLVRITMYRIDRACQICNRTAVTGICTMHSRDEDETVPPHAGTFRTAGPVDYLLSENGTGLVR